MLILPPEATQPSDSARSFKDWDGNRQSFYVVRLLVADADQRGVANSFHKAIAQYIDRTSLCGVFAGEDVLDYPLIDRLILYQRSSWMFNEISLCIEMPCTILRYFLPAPTGNGNVVTIPAARVVESRSKAVIDPLHFFEVVSKGIKVCLADVTIRQIVETRRSFSGSALTLSWFLHGRKHNQQNGYSADHDTQLNGSVHY